MIEVSNLTKRYGEVEALTQVSFSVEPGKIMGFLGVNGAGKTTTMDILAGCLGYDEGSVKICGYDITDQAIEAKSVLGYLPDVPPIHKDMTVFEFVRYAAKLNGVRPHDLKNAVEKTMTKLSLQEVTGRLVGNLSKGYRQRVALAQAIVHDPKVLILDEPTEGLDPNQIAQIRELIRSLAGDHTILLSSHILSEVQNTCEKIIIIDKGKIVHSGSYQDIISSFHADTTYILNVSNEPEKLLPKLQSHKMIKGARLAKESPDAAPYLELNFRDEFKNSNLDDIAQLTIAGGYGLRGISKKIHNLEEVFMQLTK